MSGKLSTMVNRRGIALRWRIAIFSSLAIAFLSLLASLTAYAVVRSSLVGDLQRSLTEDVARVAAAYSPSGEGDAESAQQPQAALGVTIQFYEPAGTRFAASDDAAEVQTPALPRGVVAAALSGPGSWRGELRGEPFQAALAPFALGVVAVLAPTDYIGAALGQLARVLALAALVLVGLSGLLGYLVAAAAARPVTQLAAVAAQLDPGRLEPIAYRGPNDEVGRLSAVLNDLITRLNLASDAQRTFLAETSHELRTPLTSLQGFLDRSVRRSPRR